MITLEVLAEVFTPPPPPNPALLGHRKFEHENFILEFIPGFCPAVQLPYTVISVGSQIWSSDVLNAVALLIFIFRCYACSVPLKNKVFWLECEEHRTKSLVRQTLINICRKSCMKLAVSEGNNQEKLWQNMVKERRRQLGSTECKVSMWIWSKIKIKN